MFLVLVRKCSRKETSLFSEKTRVFFVRLPSETQNYKFLKHILRKAIKINETHKISPSICEAILEIGIFEYYIQHYDGHFRTFLTNDGCSFLANFV